MLNVAPMGMAQWPLVSGLVALEFVAFGWRINREIAVGDEGRRTWLPLPDLINIAALVAVVAFCVVLPLAFGWPEFFGRMLAAGYVLIAFHPISEAAHYRLFSRDGRAIYRGPGKDIPFASLQEWASVALSLVVALAVVLWAH